MEEKDEKSPQSSHKIDILQGIKNRTLTFASAQDGNRLHTEPVDSE